MGDEEVEATNSVTGPPRSGTNIPDSLPPQSGALDSHSFSLEPQQPFTPLGHFGATAISPT
eukprot:8801000-Heterocapsa_arctica.AAC.1